MKPRLPDHIRSLKDVRDFFVHLYVKDNLIWHPDDPMDGYGHTGPEGQWVRAFSKQGAAKRQRLMDESWVALENAEIDIYCAGMWVGHYLGYNPAPEDCPKAPPFAESVKDWTPRKKRPRSES